MSEALELILLRLEAGAATADDMAALERALQTPEGRSQIVDSLMLNEVLSEMLASNHSRSSSSARREVVQFHSEQLQNSARASSHSSSRSMSTRRSRLRLQRRRPAFNAMAAAALVMLVVGVAFLYLRNRPATTPSDAHFAILEQSVGDVAEVSGARRLLSVAAVLHEGDTVEIGANSQAALVFPDNTVIRLNANTRLSGLSLKNGKQARLERGRLEGEVTPQEQGRPLVIHTPQAAATVVGTEFVLEVSAAATRLDVDTGTVRLARLSDGKAVDVAVKQFAVAAPGQELVAKPLAPPSIATRTLTLQPIADTYVRAGTEAALNFGSSTQLGVKNDGGIDRTKNRETFLRFDLSGVNGRITHARLRLHVFGMDAKARYTHAIALLGDAVWQETGMTWKNKLAGGIELASWTPQPNGFVTVDLTPSLKSAFQNHATWTLRIFAPNVENEHSWCFYSSKETKHPPTLTLTVIEP